MISVRILPKKIRREKQKEISKYEILAKKLSRKTGSKRAWKIRPGGEARSRSNIFLLRKNILQGLVMVSTGIMQLEKRVARDALNSTIKIKR